MTLVKNENGTEVREEAPKNKTIKPKFLDKQIDSTRLRSTQK